MNCCGMNACPGACSCVPLHVVDIAFVVVVDMSVAGIEDVVAAVLVVKLAPAWTNEATLRGSICADVMVTGREKPMGDTAKLGNGDVCTGEDSEERADKAARGDGIGKRLPPGVRGVVSPLSTDVGVFGGRVSGVTPTDRPGIVPTCWTEAVDVAVVQ